MIWNLICHPENVAILVRIMYTSVHPLHSKGRFQSCRLRPALALMQRRGQRRAPGSSFLEYNMCLHPQSKPMNHQYPLVNVYITMENHHFSWENSLFLCQCSIAFSMFTRGYACWNSGLGSCHNFPSGLRAVEQTEVPATSTLAADLIRRCSNRNFPRLNVPNVSKTMGSMKYDITWHDKYWIT